MSRAALLEAFDGDQLKVAQSRSLSSTNDYSVTQEPQLIEALLQLFEGNCAFCESPTEKPKVYRFRPKANAEPVDDLSTSHLYYAWLSEAWQNLYPICEECVPKRESYFPLNGKRSGLPQLGEIERFVESQDGMWPAVAYPPDEKPVLLDPCQDRQIWRNLGFSVDGVAVSRSRRGLETIDHFQLNRASLVEQRHRVINEEIAYTRMDLKGEERREITWMEGAIGHQGAVRLFMRNALARALNSSPTSDLDRQRRALYRLRDGVERFDRVIDTLRGEQQEQPKPHREPERKAIPDSFTSIEVRNYKSLERIELKMPDPPLFTSSGLKEPSLLILGENATGKSSILEAIALGAMPREARERLKFKPSEALLNPKYMGASDKTPPQKAVISLTYGEDTKRVLTLTHDQFESSEIRDEGSPPHIPLFAYGAYRQFLEKERNFAQHKHIRSLFEPDELLSNPEKWLSKLSDPHFNMVVRALREVFNVEGTFDVIDRSESGIFVVSQQVESDMTKTRREPISVVSSGFRAVLAMLCDIMQGLMDKRINPSFQSLETAQGLVLIDEIEAHLHPRWKMSIMTGLRRALPRVSFIATSHDPLCLRGMGKDEVLVLERVSGDMVETDLPIFTQALVNLPDNEKWTVEQLLTADFFQLRTTESAAAEKRAAEMEDKLAAGVNPTEDIELALYLEEFSRDLPIGHTEVHRLVQDAIEKYLRLRRNSTKTKLARLKAETRSSILNALKRFG